MNKAKGRLILALAFLGAVAFGSASVGVFRPDEALTRHRGILCLTFDDGHFDSWRKALPLFDQYGARATFFVNGEIGPQQVAALREFQSRGHSVGLHGLRHLDAVRRCAEVGAEAYFAEEVEPQLAPVRQAGLSVRNWGYPNSERNGTTDDVLLRCFSRLRTGHVFGRDPAKMPLAACDAAFVPREEIAERKVLSGMGFGSKFPGIAEDLERGLERLAERDEALVLYSHDIKAVSDNNKNNTSLDVLERVLSKAHALGVAVVGFDDLDELRRKDVVLENTRFRLTLPPMDGWRPQWIEFHE